MRFRIDYDGMHYSVYDMDGHAAPHVHAVGDVVTADEFDKVTAELKAVTAERDRLRDVCKKLATRTTGPTPAKRGEWIAWALDLAEEARAALAKETTP